MRPNSSKGYHQSTSEEIRIKAKQEDWRSTHDRLSTRQAWEDLLEGCKASRKRQVIEMVDPLGLVAWRSVAYLKYSKPSVGKYQRALSIQFKQRFLEQMF